MSNPTKLELIQLSLAAVSFVIYVWFLVTIVRFRKIRPFNSSFFTLSLVLGVCDLQCLFANWVLHNFASFGWLYMDTLVQRFSTAMAKIHQILAIQGCNQQFVAVAIMALNRCTALAYFGKHELIWTPRFLRGMVCLQVLVPLALTCPVVITQDVFYQIDNVTGDVVGLRWGHKDVQVYIIMGSFVHLWLVNILSAILYCIAFWKMRKTLKPKYKIVRPKRASTVITVTDNRKIEVRLALVGLSLSCLLTIYGCILYKMFTTVKTESVMFEVYSAAWGVTNDIFSWCNPWLCLIMSRSVRQRMWAALRCTATNNERTRTRAPTKSDRAYRVIELLD